MTDQQRQDLKLLRMLIDSAKEASFTEGKYSFAAMLFITMFGFCLGAQTYSSGGFWPLIVMHIVGVVLCFRGAVLASRDRVEAQLGVIKVAAVLRSEGVDVKTS